MELELLKTFLEVRKTQHFGKAANNLGVTQAAISIRIRQLENHLGSPLFVRFRNNLQLTEAGEKLVYHAEDILGQWEKAKQEINLRKLGKKTIRLGATTGYCGTLLKYSLAPIYKTLDHITMRSESRHEDTLNLHLREKKIDLALLYDPFRDSDFESRPVSSLELTLVSTVPGQTLEEATQTDYIAVEWGSFFNSRFLKLLSQMPNPVLQATVAEFAVQFLIDHGGFSYLPYRLVEEHLGSDLHLVEGARILHQPIYAIYRKASPFAAELEAIVDVIAENVAPKTATLDVVLQEAMPVQPDNVVSIA